MDTTWNALKIQTRSEGTLVHSGGLGSGRKQQSLEHEAVSARESMLSAEFLTPY